MKGFTHRFYSFKLVMQIRQVDQQKDGWFENDFIFLSELCFMHCYIIDNGQWALFFMLNFADVNSMSGYRDAKDVIKH